MKKNLDRDNSSAYLFHKPQTTRNDFLGVFIKQFIIRRETLNLTQDDIDQRMGNADRLCSKWECGLRTPTSFNLLCWAEALDSSLLLRPKKSD